MNKARLLVAAFQKHPMPAPQLCKLHTHGLAKALVDLGLWAQEDVNLSKTQMWELAYIGFLFNFYKKERGVAWAD